MDRRDAPFAQSRTAGAKYIGAAPISGSLRHSRLPLSLSAGVNHEGDGGRATSDFDGTPDATDENNTL
jgi:hypothetical protein